MKKLLAIVLAAAMLCALAGLGASALTAEEQAAWALAEGTQNIFESGTFTTESYGTVFTMDGDRMVTERPTYTSRLFFGVPPSPLVIFRDRCRQAIAEFLLGERRRLITTPEGNFISFPARCVYAQIDPSIQISTTEPDTLRNLWPNHNPDTFTVTAYPECDHVEAALKWENIERPAPNSVVYMIKGEKVAWFEYGYNWTSEFWWGDRGFDMANVTPQADASFFSTQGMCKLPWWLMNALLGFIGEDYNHRVAGSIDMNPVIAKPVIYLYPERPMEVGVTLQLNGARFTETIPDYGAGWNVLARPDGTLTNLADGGEYPYLFWEALPDAPWPRPQEGFVVAREDLAAFLDEKLAYLGLNGAEAGEFMEFWLPILAKNEYSFLHFAGQDYTNRFPLSVSPAPDSLLRVFMVAGAAQEGERAAPQKLVPFERKGFAVVEWGGTIL